MGFIRRTIIVLGEILALLLIVIFTLLGVVYGVGIAIQFAAINGADVSQIDNVRRVGIWLGGIAGFSVAIVMTGIFFALAEIARNTRDEVLIQTRAK
jgi:TRAP-type C4-dicarboxylate transport system permease small subunit